MPMPADELCALLGVRPRTLRSWIRAGLVPRPPFRGRATEYSDAAVLRAQAVAALRRENLPIALVRRQVSRATPDELRAIAGIAPPPAPAPVVIAPPPPPPPEPEPEPAPPPAEVSAAPPGAAWRRIELVPGLELHVREDAGPLALRIASDIAAARWPSDQGASSSRIG